MLVACDTLFPLMNMRPPFLRRRLSSPKDAAKATRRSDLKPKSHVAKRRGDEKVGYEVAGELSDVRGFLQFAGDRADSGVCVFGGRRAGCSCKPLFPVAAQAPVGSYPFLSRNGICDPVAHPPEFQLDLDSEHLHRLFRREMVEGPCRSVGSLDRRPSGGLAAVLPAMSPFRISFLNRSSSFL